MFCIGMYNFKLQNHLGYFHSLGLLRNKKEKETEKS